MAHAGTYIGMGINVSLAAGLAKITEKMSPRRMESLPAYGLTYPCSICCVKRSKEPRAMESTMTLARKMFPCIMPRLWHSKPMIKLSIKKEKKLVWLK